MKKTFILLACSLMFFVSCSLDNKKMTDEEDDKIDNKTIEKLQELENKMDTLDTNSDTI